jgi:hypothetical protein
MEWKVSRESLITMGWLSTSQTVSKYRLNYVSMFAGFSYFYLNLPIHKNNNEDIQK